MDKKKICIGIIIILVILIVVCGILFILKNKNIETDKESSYLAESNTNNETIENTTIDNEVDIANAENAEIPEEQQSIETESIDNNVQTTTKDNTKEKQTSQTQTSQSNNKQTSTTTSTQKETATTSTATATTSTVTSQTQEPSKETVSTPSTPASSQTTTEGPKYVRNDAMINKIKQIIQNNETDEMKNFGYTIVVDSSIKELTNQFTFSETRVINAIKYKFGTIRIYVEDYYNNGELVMTECYII